MSKPFPQGLEPGEEFRDDDILGLYKPTDTASAVDGSLNKGKTILELKTMIEDEVINTNTANIAVNEADITTLEGRATVNEGNIDALEVRATTNEGDIDALEVRATTLETKTPQSYKTTDTVTFASVNTGYGANEVVPEDVYFDLRTSSSDVAVSPLSPKGTGHISINNTSGSTSNLLFPSTGYSFYLISMSTGTTLSVISSAVQHDLPNGYNMLTYRNTL